MIKMDEMDENLEKFILSMTKHLGRKPTYNEVHAFIFGTPAEREKIYKNKGL